MAERAAALALKRGGQSLGHQELMATALSVSQCTKILAESREGERRLTDTEESREILLAGLEESPPPSFETLALRAGRSAEHVHLLFPGLYREVLHRHGDYWRQQRARKRQAVRDQVEHVARKICSLGLYPSRERVRSFLADTSVSEQAIKQALTYLRQSGQLPRLPKVIVFTSGGRGNNSRARGLPAAG